MTEPLRSQRVASLATDDWDCNLDLSNLEHIVAIGAGSSGTIFEHYGHAGLVMKSYRNEAKCVNARHEYDLQKRIYSAFTAIQHNEEWKKYIAKLEIARPAGFCDVKHGESYNIAGEPFSCYFVMSKLNGIPKAFLNAPPDQAHGINERVPAQREIVESQKEINVQLAFNYKVFREGGGSRSYGYKFGGGGVSLTGYYCGKQQYETSLLKPELTTALQRQKGVLSSGDIEETIGFVYGYMLFGLNLIPNDIEFILGLYATTEWPKNVRPRHLKKTLRGREKITGLILKINLLDFDQILNIEHFDNWPDNRKEGMVEAERKWRESGNTDWSGFEESVLDSAMGRDPYSNKEIPCTLGGFYEARRCAIDLKIASSYTGPPGQSLIETVPECFHDEHKVCGGSDTDITIAANQITLNDEEHSIHVSHHPQISVQPQQQQQSAAGNVYGDLLYYYNDNDQSDGMFINNEYYHGQYGGLERNNNNIIGFDQVSMIWSELFIIIVILGFCCSILMIFCIFASTNMKYIFSKKIVGRETKYDYEPNDDDHCIDVYS